MGILNEKVEFAFRVSGGSGGDIVFLPVERYCYVL